MGRDGDELGVLRERRWRLSPRAAGGLSHFPPLRQDGEGLAGPHLQRSLQMLLSIQGPRLHHPGRRRPRHLPAHLRVSQWLVCVVRGYGGHRRASSEAGRVCGQDGFWVGRCELVTGTCDQRVAVCRGGVVRLLGGVGVSDAAGDSVFVTVENHRGGAECPWVSGGWGGAPLGVRGAMFGLWAVSRPASGEAAW